MTTTEPRSPLLPKIGLFLLLGLCGCKGLPYEPVPCHGNSPPSDSASGIVRSTRDSVFLVLRAHTCGYPRAIDR